jgi:hypothetical protein
VLQIAPATHRELATASGNVFALNMVSTTALSWRGVNLIMTAILSHVQTAKQAN